jgi:hypothetical protein
MKTVLRACLVAGAVLLGQLALTAAENVRLKHLTSVYFDDKAVGLNLPEGIACGANGQVVVGDTGNDRLMRFTYGDNKVSGQSVIKIPQLGAPARIQLTAKGEIYALDGRQRRIVHLGAGGEFKEVVAFAGVPAPATIVPKDFAIDSADNIYVLDVFSARVIVLGPQGQFQKAVPLPPDIGFGAGLAIDAVGRLVLLDSIDRRVFVAEKGAGSFTALARNVPESLAGLPTYVTTSKGVIFVVEASGSIVAFGQDGSFLSRQLGTGREEGQLDHPSQICVNDRDEVFVADRDNSRVQVFRLIR